VLPAGVKLVKHGTKDPVVVTVTEPKEEEIVVPAAPRRPTTRRRARARSNSRLLALAPKPRSAGFFRPSRPEVPNSIRLTDVR
jgi:hypothetical protein